jgi:prevent-host-death family protein
VAKPEKLVLTLLPTNCIIQLFELSVMPTTKRDPIVISALRARSNLGALLRRIEKESRSLVIQKRGTPRAVLLSIHQYVRLAAPEPEILRAIGEASKNKGTDTLTSAQIDRIIARARNRKPKR